MTKPVPTQDEVRGWLLGLREESTRPAAAAALAGIGPESGDLVPSLVAALDDPAASLVATRTLGQIGAAAVDALPALRASLESEEHAIRTHAALALGRIGSAEPADRTRLARLFDDVEPLVRVAAAGALLALGEPSPVAVRILLDARALSGVVIRFWAATGLADAVATNPLARAASVALFDDWDDAIREYVAHSLAALDADEIVPMLLASLPDRPDHARAGALLVLCILGPRARAHDATITSTLLEIGAFRSPTRELVRRAANVARAVPLDSADIVAALTPLLDSHDVWIAEQAADALLTLTRTPDQAAARARAVLERG